MRHVKPKAIPQHRPLVGMVLNCANAYGRNILRGATRYANLQRKWVLYSDLERVIGVDDALPDFDGAIVGGVPWGTYRHILAHCKHTVHCSGSGQPELSPIVSLDDQAVGIEAANHLLNCGLEHFAFFGNSSYSVGQARLEGFRQTVEGRGFATAVSPLEIPTAQQRLSHEQHPRIIDWLNTLPKPVGIMAFDDTAASDLASACLRADISVPDTVAIIGVNNDDLLCESAWPPLSSVKADYSRIGYLAATVLDRMLNGETLKPEERWMKLPPLGVVRRQSTTTLAINDRSLADAVRYIREHACQPCSVGDVLKHVPVGRRWLERRFIAQLGRTPADEIARIRMDVAKRLLLRSEMDMHSVALRCGFKELKSFYLVFRRITGTTPAAYRKTALFGM